MIKVEQIETYGWEAAIRGMRNPMNSWNKSDSAFYCYPETGIAHKIGQNDLDLMQRLFKTGTEHRKYLRQITVSMDIIAPLYWWKEFDTYKVGTVANSCSTMHKIHSKEFMLEDFSHEQLKGLYLKNLKNTIIMLNDARDAFLQSKDKLYWWQMIQLLPSSYNQKRTVTMNYETVVAMIRQRSGHKLDEWRLFVEVLKQLPYITQIMGESK